MPVKISERHIILDALRGFAIFGIALANFTEFSLYSFLDADTVASMPSHRTDSIVHFLQYMFVDGKFYSIFSLLFGIGFSIIISNAMKRGANGFRVFYRRMLILFLIGIIHLMFIWSGDIVALYALLGMLLPLFRRVSDRGLLIWSGVLLGIPILVDAFQEISGISLSAPVVAWQQRSCARYGITEANFATWLRDIDDYRGMFQFLLQGAIVRLQEFIDGNRWFKVLGLFLLGLWAGRQRIYASLEAFRPLLRKLFRGGLVIGLPLSFVYAWSATHAHPWGLTLHSILHAASVYPMFLCYVCGISLLCADRPGLKIFKAFAAPGRMALSNYTGQSLIGCILFYGIGFGLGTRLGLAAVEAVAAAAFLFQMLFSYVWLNYFRFGPLEWVWRMLSYGRRFALRKERD